MSRSMKVLPNSEMTSVTAEKKELSEEGEIGKHRQAYYLLLPSVGDKKLVNLKPEKLRELKLHLLENIVSVVSLSNNSAPKLWQMLCYCRQAIALVDGEQKKVWEKRKAAIHQQLLVVDPEAKSSLEYPTVSYKTFSLLIELNNSVEIKHKLVMHIVEIIRHRCEKIRTKKTVYLEDFYEINRILSQFSNTLLVAKETGTKIVEEHRARIFQRLLQAYVEQLSSVSMKRERGENLQDFHEFLMECVRFKGLGQGKFGRFLNEQESWWSMLVIDLFHSHCASGKKLTARFLSSIDTLLGESPNPTLITLISSLMLKGLLVGFVRAKKTKHYRIMDKALILINALPGHLKKITISDREAKNGVVEAYVDTDYAKCILGMIGILAKSVESTQKDNAKTLVYLANLMRVLPVDSLRKRGKIELFKDINNLLEVKDMFLKAGKVKRAALKRLSFVFDSALLAYRGSKDSSANILDVFVRKNIALDVRDVEKTRAYESAGNIYARIKGNEKSYVTIKLRLLTVLTIISKKSRYTVSRLNDVIKHADTAIALTTTKAQRQDYQKSKEIATKALKKLTKPVEKKQAEKLGASQVLGEEKSERKANLATAKSSLREFWGPYYMMMLRIDVMGANSPKYQHAYPPLPLLNKIDKLNKEGWFRPGDQSTLESWKATLQPLAAKPNHKSSQAGRLFASRVDDAGTAPAPPPSFDSFMTVTI